MPSTRTTGSTPNGSFVFEASHHADAGRLFHAGEAFFDRCEKIDAPDILALLTRWKRTGSRVLELGCGSDRDACHIASLGADVTACDGSSPLPERAQALAGSERNPRLLQAVMPPDRAAVVRIGQEPFDAVYTCGML